MHPRGGTGAGRNPCPGQPQPPVSHPASPAPQPAAHLHSLARSLARHDLATAPSVLLSLVHLCPGPSRTAPTNVHLQLTVDTVRLPLVTTQPANVPCRGGCAQLRLSARKPPSKSPLPPAPSTQPQSLCCHRLPREGFGRHLIPSCGRGKQKGPLSL